MDRTLVESYGALMGGILGWIGASSRRTAGAVVVLALTFLVILAFTVPIDQFCDGAYERWRLPDDYRGGGCPAVTPAVHGILPWNWGERDLVCTGLCPGGLLPAPIPTTSP